MEFDRGYPFRTPSIKFHLFRFFHLYDCRYAAGSGASSLPPPPGLTLPTPPDGFDGAVIPL